MSNPRKIASKAKAHRSANKKVRAAGNRVTDTSATRDSMRSGRRLYGCGLAR